MRSHVFAKPLSQANRGLLTICCCFLVITVLWLGVCLDNNAMVLAKLSKVGNVETLKGAVASHPNVLEDLEDKVKDDLDEKAGSETDYLGLNNSGMKHLKSNIDSPDLRFNVSAKQTESAGNAIDERSEENVAKIQGKAANSEHKVENGIRDVMSNVKDRFN